MTDLKFTPEDFIGVIGNGPALFLEASNMAALRAEVAARANARLAEMLAEAPVVYEGPDGAWRAVALDCDRSARLVAIENIEGEK